MKTAEMVIFESHHATDYVLRLLASEKCCVAVCLGKYKGVINTSFAVNYNDWENKFTDFSNHVLTELIWKQESVFVLYSDKTAALVDPTNKKRITEYSQVSNDLPREDQDYTYCVMLGAYLSIDGEFVFL